MKNSRYLPLSKPPFGPIPEHWHRQQHSFSVLTSHPLDPIPGHRHWQQHSCLVMFCFPPCRPKHLASFILSIVDNHTLIGKIDYSFIIQTYPLLLSKNMSKDRLILEIDREREREYRVEWQNQILNKSDAAPAASGCCDDICCCVTAERDLAYERLFTKCQSPR